MPGALEAADALQRATVEMVRRGYEEFGTTFEFYDSKAQVLVYRASFLVSL